MHDLEESLVARLQLPIGQVDTLEECANFEEELESVFFILHVTIVPHLADQFGLDALKIFSKDVVENDLVVGTYQLHDSMARILVNEPCHRRVLQVLQLVAQVDRVDD